MISYARNFEDVMLVRALRHIDRGFYVDVGASHPIADSNTYALYGMGWRGVAIEPQPVFNDLWQAHRPEDLLVNAALANQAGQTTLFKPTEYGQGATINTHFAQHYAQRGLSMTEVTVPVHTLTEVLLATRLEGDIHLLTIDVEGAEESVLRGLDWVHFDAGERVARGAHTPLRRLGVAAIGSGL
jgi:FkbM family methyltransferase